MSTIENTTYTDAEKKNALKLFHQYKLAIANLEVKKEPGEVVDLYDLYNPSKKIKISENQESFKQLYKVPTSVSKSLYTKRQSESINSEDIDKRQFIRCWSDGNCNKVAKGKCPYFHKTDNEKIEPLNVYQQFSKLTTTEIVFILEHSIQVVNYKNGIGFIYRNIMYETLINLVEDKSHKK